MLTKGTSRIVVYPGMTSKTLGEVPGMSECLSDASVAAPAVCSQLHLYPA
jgi:hypothetical protein